MSGPARLLQMHGAVVDLVYWVEAVPRTSEEAIVSDFRITPGGGFNALAAARRSGLEVAYGGGLGTGPLADLVEAGLAAEGVENLRPRDPDRDQGCCTVMVEPTGERTFVAKEGAEGHLTGEELGQCGPGTFGWALLSGYALHYPGSREALGRWLQSRASLPQLVFDPSPVVGMIAPDYMAAALGRATWISANTWEAAVLTGHDDPEASAGALAAERPEGGAIVRTGAAGCILSSCGRTVALPGHPVDAVDTNGAGDAHIGAFIAAMAQGASSEEAARYANVAAALSTTRRGPATAPNRETVFRTSRERRAG